MGPALLHILQGPIVSLFMMASVIAFAFTFAFRRHDANAPILCGVLIVLWLSEIVAKAAMGDGFRSFLPMSDLIAALVAYRLGINRPSDWIRGAYISLVASCAVHVFYQWGESASVMSARQYVTVLNVLFLVRLVCILTPGVSHVGQTLGAALLRSGRVPAVAMATSREGFTR